MRNVAVFFASVFIATRISGESIDDSTFTSHVYAGHVYPGHVNFNDIFSNSISMLADDTIATVAKDEEFHLPPSQYAEFRLISYTTVPSTAKPKTTPKPRKSKRKAAIRWDLDDLNVLKEEARKVSADRTRRLIFKLPASHTALKPSNRFRNILVNKMNVMTGPKTRFLKPSFLRGNDPDTTSENPSSTNRGINGSTIETTTNGKNITSPLGVNVVPLKNYQRGVLDLILPASRVKNFRDVFQTFKRLLSYTFRK